MANTHVKEKMIKTDLVSSDIRRLQQSVMCDKRKGNT